ncbi:Uncharacterized protein Rs2_27030 [Raphanus sativus]|nr:Uncharacterized protein Rs2_27030 [Raphanus sativus]
MGGDDFFFKLISSSDVLGCCLGLRIFHHELSQSTTNSVFVLRFVPALRHDMTTSALLCDVSVFLAMFLSSAAKIEPSHESTSSSSYVVNSVSITRGFLVVTAYLLAMLSSTVEVVVIVGIKMAVRIKLAVVDRELDQRQQWPTLTFCAPGP